MEETELNAEDTHAEIRKKLEQNLQEVKFTHEVQRTRYTWVLCLEKCISFTLILLTVYHGGMGVEQLIIPMQIGCIC